MEGHVTPSEINTNEVNTSAEKSPNLDTSQSIDFSNDNYDFSDLPTEKDGNKETEGQLKENTVSEQAKLDMSNPIDYSETTDLSERQDSLNEKEQPVIEKDDNGKPYKENGEMLPNNDYTVRGYDYKTDDQGRIINASGDLNWKDHEGRLDMPDSIHDIGKGSERNTDDRGHLIADEFNGSGGKENLVPMDSYLNQHGDYRKLEQEWEQALDTGQKVHVDIDVDYSGDSKRPDSFTVAYEINGEYYEKTFLNEDNRGE